MDAKGEIVVNRQRKRNQGRLLGRVIGYLMIVYLIANGSALYAADMDTSQKGTEPIKSADSQGGSPEKSEDVVDIVKKIQAFYVDAGDYQAAFVQTTSHKMFAGKLERAYGTVKFKKGGLMRWEYVKPEKKLFIYDGKTLWIYEPEVPQVFSGSADAERLKRALAFISGEGKILDEYRVKLLNSAKFNFPEGYVLSLVPKDEQSPYDHVELYVNKNSFRVMRSVIVDRDNNRNRLDFNNPSTGNNIPAQEFAFTPPKGVPVIDPLNQQ